MGKSASDEKILSYNDVVLRESDLGILSGPNYLNDRIIEFYFSYLSSCYPSPDILLVSPSIAFWMSNCPDPASLKDFVEPLNFPSRKLVIFPVNDNTDVTMAEGGSHWSLLAFERDSNLFVHHDSNNGMNNAHGRRLFKAIAGHMGIGNSEACYIECSTPQQENGYDCGLYVTAIARAICCWYINDRHVDGSNLWFDMVSKKASQTVVSKMRNEILELIRNLMAEK